MEELKRKIIHAAIGASGGVTGIVALARCSGGACTSCFGCAGAGIGILLAAVLGKMKRRVKEDGTA